MQVYDIALKASESRQIHVQADYIYFLNGSAGGADTTIEFRPNSGGETVFLKPGQAFKLPESQRGQGITWVMKNLKGEATIVGQVLMGEGEFQDNRISGSVEVIDGGKARSLAGMAFAGCYGSGNAASKYARIVFFNPAVSSKNIVIETIAMSSEAALPVNVFRSNAQGTGATSQGICKNTKIVTASALLVNQDAEQITQGPGGIALWQMSVQANAKDVWRPAEPIVLVPGAGVVLWGQFPGVGFVVSVEWFEEQAQ